MYSAILALMWLVVGAVFYLFHRDISGCVSLLSLADAVIACAAQKMSISFHCYLTKTKSSFHSFKFPAVLNSGSE